LPLIELEKQGFSYPSAPRPALLDLSLSIDEGEYLAIVGPNGSGKSSLLRLLDGLMLPSSGELRVDSVPTSDEAGRRAARKAVALVFQSPIDQIISTAVEEDIAFGPENLGLPRAEIRRRVDEALAAVGLEGERATPTHFLSAGQQQRLAIAGAIAMEPRCIAFDEATAMLDPPSKEAVLALMEGLVARGVAVVHVTHDMAEAVRADRIVALDSGRMAFDGSPGEFLAARPLPVLGLPPAAALALELGLEPLARESAAALATRIVAASPPLARPTKIAAADAVAGSATGSAADPVEPAFLLEGVGYSHLRGTSSERRALSGVSTALPRGARVALVGKTGSGKSSLLQLLDALAFPSEGRVVALGADTAARGTDVRRLRMRAPLAIQGLESALFEPYAGDDVAFGPRNLGLEGKELVARVRRAMEACGLPYAEFRDRMTRSLSGGEKRKLALAGIVAMESEALLLDEPSSALDPRSRAQVMDLVLGRPGTTVVFATHSMEEAARADLVAVMVEGRLAAIGEPESVFYLDYDPGWGIGRPFAVEAAAALEALGVELGARPLDLPSLGRALARALLPRALGPGAKKDGTGEEGAA
jgi:energy-coupling factor transporter ATP-binding protein EcfA2